MINNKRTLDVLRSVIKVIVSFITVTLLTFELWEKYDVPKNYWYYLGVVLSLVLIFVIRKISFKDYEVWISLCIGFAFKYLYFKRHNINADYYGEIYSKVISYTWVIWILFATLMVNCIRRRYIISVIRKKFVAILIYGLIATVSFVVFKQTVIPIICPVLALVFSEIGDDEWNDTVNCFAVGVYASFVYLIVKSMIYYPDVYENGRYMGGFCSVENMGMFCGAALVCCLYFFVKTVRMEKRKWYILLIVIIMGALPAYVIAKTDSRTTILGVLLASVFAFIFVRKKTTNKAILIRMGVVVVTTVAFVLFLFALGRHLSKGYLSGKYDYEKMGYLTRHIVVLGESKYRKGYFGDDSILNVINSFASGRLVCYAEAIKQIEWKGHEFRDEPPYHIASSHNFFITRLIEMGLIPGALMCLWVLFCIVNGCRLCARGSDTAIFSLMWTVYSVVILSCTITRWYSLIPFGMYFLSYPLFSLGLRRQKALDAMD